jgi:uncharacterized protein YndB with AHSA1/START domain
MKEQIHVTEKEMVKTIKIKATRELVFKVWTEPKHLKEWWGPYGFTNPVCEVDLRKGGSIRIEMQAPDGIKYPMTGYYEEIVRPERLVFTSMALDNEGNEIFEVLNTITFIQQGSFTNLTVYGHVTKETSEAKQYLDGMDEGWGQSLERLVDYIKKL